MEIDIKNLNTASEFCPQCGNMIEMPLYSDKVECSKCEFICSVLEYKCAPIVSRIEFNQKKQWLEQYKASQKKKIHGIEEEDLEDKHKHKKATLKQECPDCGHDTLYFWTVQTRSADEGSTVFYECQDCKYKFTANN
ncbi:hypothetical protein ABPG74_015203 [Tetrahymena malaccensis]